MASTAEEVPALPIVNDVRQYEKLHRVGEGTYGVVYKVRHKETGEIRALKRVRMDRERDGIPVTSMRELRVLQSCRHPGIVQLEGVVTGASLDSVFLVFEYCPHDLGRLLDSVHRPFREAEVKCLMAQLLDAVAFLHDRWVIHRDLKMSNLLYTHAGTLKVCDFGLARSMQPWEEAYTQRVVTLWYRAPELLLGCEKYTEAIDVWSIGCIMAELLRHEPLFPAKTEIQALHMMCKVLGAPTAAAWPQLPSLPHASKFKLPYQPFNYLRKEIPGLSDAAHELLTQLLRYNPADRISARRALQHRWFCTEPFPPANMPTFRSTHPSGTSKKRPAGVDSRDLGEQRAAKRERQLQEHRRFGLAFDVGSSSRDLGRSRQAKQRLSQL